MFLLHFGVGHKKINHRIHHDVKVMIQDGLFDKILCLMLRKSHCVKIVLYESVKMPDLLDHVM